jgi:long-chain fatty acid transport protein
MWQSRLQSMRFSFALALATSLASSSAFGAGFYITDIGARGMGRAGALVARSDDLLAIHYNPSGLSLLKGLHVQGDMQIVQYNVTFERHCPCLPDGALDRETIEADLERGFAENPVKSDTPLFIPFLSAAYGLDFLDITVAFALWGPTSGRHNYGELPPPDRPSFLERTNEFPQRYSGLEMINLEANIAFGLAMSPIDGLRLGFTAMIFQNGADQTVHLWANLESFALGPEDPTLDIPILFSFKESLGFNWVVGASYDLPFLDGLSIGASFRGKRDIRTDGTIDVNLPAKLNGVATVDGDRVTVELATAPIARAGIQYGIQRLFSAEFAFVWEGWQSHDDVVIRPQNIEFQIQGMDPVQLPKIVAERRWKNSWSTRLGGEIQVLEPYLGIRAGWFYEPTAIPDDRLDPSRMDFNKHGIALGLSTTWFGFTLEVSGMAILMQSRDITDSQTKLISPLAGTPGANPDYETFIANGHYSGRYFIFGASLHFALDPLLEEI